MLTILGTYFLKGFKDVCISEQDSRYFRLKAPKNLTFKKSLRNLTEIKELLRRAYGTLKYTEELLGTLRSSKELWGTQRSKPTLEAVNYW